MPRLTELFQLNTDRTLYHYTGIGSILGMEKTNSIWASHAYYLNDSKEVLHAIDVLETALRPQLAFGQLTAEELVFANQFLHWSRSFKGNRYNIFVFSLSEERSLLSQWRSYTPHGKGISIGFSAELIERLMQENQMKLAKCIYEGKDQEQVLRDLFQRLLADFREQKPKTTPDHTPPETSYFPFLEKYRNDVLQTLAIIKHDAFKEECEWRLISNYYEYFTAPEIHYREGSSMLVPYIMLDLGRSRPIFETVILGPSPHEELSFSALHMFLSNRRLCNSTENSRIPYREW